MTDLLLEVFPDFDSSHDADAAVKFCLNAIICNSRIPFLIDLLDPTYPLAELEGDPGWTIERRMPSLDPKYYVQWPDWAAYRTFLPHETFEVGFPECYSTNRQFTDYASRLVTAYVSANPRLADRVRDAIWKGVKWTE